MTGNPCSPARRSDGFTLIEITVMLILLAVMASMALPSLSGYLDRTRTRRALDQVTADIAHARILAVQRGTRAAINIDPQAARYTVDTMSAAGVWGTMKTVNLRNDFTGIILAGTATSLEFTSRGLLATPADSGTVTVVRNAVRDSAFVSPTGRVYRAF